RGPRVPAAQHPGAALVRYDAGDEEGPGGVPEHAGLVVRRAPHGCNNPLGGCILEMLQVPEGACPPTPPGSKGSNGTWCLTSLRKAWSTFAGSLRSTELPASFCGRGRSALPRIAR